MTLGSEYMNVGQAAQLLGLHEETVRDFARRRRLPAFKAGRSWRFERRKLAEWAEEQLNSAEPPQVLVVDDEREILNIVRIKLQRIGCRATTAATAEEGIAALEKELPDLAILDLKLPKRSGVDVIQEIRARTRNLPIVVVTGYPDSELMDRAMKFSPLVVLSKPIDFQALARVVRGTLIAAGAMNT